MTKLDEKSTIPLFAVLSMLPFLIAGLMWLTSVAADAKQGAKAYDMIVEIKESLTRIETQLGTLPKKERK